VKDAHERKMKKIIRAAGRHKSAKVLPTYAKRMMKQVAEGATDRARNRLACSVTTVAAPPS
jgi:hypothetical protein